MNAIEKRLRSVYKKHDESDANQYADPNLGKTVTYNAEDIPVPLPLDDFDTIKSINSKDRLLVTIGDSWTWGDSLTPLLADHNLHDPEMAKINHDQEKRKELLYGRHLSNLLDADWVNYGLPGYSNFYILERFAQALDYYSDYDDIYFVLCLTETGRELAWITLDTPVIQDYNNDPSRIFIDLEQSIVDRIYKLYGDRDLSKLLITRNFTKFYPDIECHTNDLKTWVEINQQHQGDTTNTTLTGPLTDIGTTPARSIFENHCGSHNNMTEYLDTKYDDMISLITFMEKSYLHNHKTTKHPTAESHRLWADYLYGRITNT